MGGNSKRRVVYKPEKTADRKTNNIGSHYKTKNSDEKSENIGQTTNFIKSENTQTVAEPQVIADSKATANSQTITDLQTTESTKWDKGPANRRLIIIAISAFVLVAALLCTFIFTPLFNPLKKAIGKGSSANNSKVVDAAKEGGTESTISGSEASKTDNSQVKSVDFNSDSSRIFGMTLTLNKEFKETDTNENIASLTDEIAKDGLTTVFINAIGDDGSIISKEIMGKIALSAKEKSLTTIMNYDISKISAGDIAGGDAIQKIESDLNELISIDGVGGVILDGISRNPDGTDFSNYVSCGTLTGYKKYSENLLTESVKKISDKIKANNGNIMFGVVSDSVYASSAYKAGGINCQNKTEMLKDKNADVLYWINNGFFDTVFVKADTTTDDKDLSFNTVLDWWDKNTPQDVKLGFVLSSDKAVSGDPSWKNPDQLTRQLMTLKNKNRYVFCFNSFSSLKNDKSGAANLVYKYLTGNVEDNFVLSNLTFTSPSKRTFTVYEDNISFIGASDPNFDLILNGAKVERTKYGYFSLQKNLKIGNNVFKFTHKGSDTTFNITYRYTVIKNYSPAKAITLDGGSILVVKATARKNSTVIATLNGKSVKLEPEEVTEGSEFLTYIGSFQLASGYKKNTSLGNVVFKGTNAGHSESFTGGKVTVKADPSDYKPDTGGISGSNNGYISVGNNLIAEVIQPQIETFDVKDPAGKTVVNDYSQPYNSYLPKGTVDYCSNSTVYDPSSGNTYRILRYGKRVYTVSKGINRIKTFKGTLPSDNKLSVKSLSTSGKYTTLVMGSEWKAPFKLILSPQNYKASKGSDRGIISSATFNYIDINFCYASSLSGSINRFKDSPVFSNAQIIKNKSDYTLRLYLKKVGAFYGWTADYNSNGDLVFKFLNPVKAKKASNKYGGTLNGITIMIDAGHGGSDGGASGNNPRYDEADRSLLLAKKLEQKLKSIGATVVMTRTSDVSLSPDDRMARARNASANLGIAVHRNSSTGTSANGFQSYYFNPYTKKAADLITNSVKSSGTYETVKNTGWHVFYMSRISNYPIVLTENGFMSNSKDYNNMLSDSWNDKCADAIVSGVVKYFLTID